MYDYKINYNNVYYNVQLIVIIYINLILYIKRNVK